MRERPIIFSAPMVRAILDGRKSQTRRIVKHKIDGQDRPHEIFDWYDKKGNWIAAHGGAFAFEKTNAAQLCPYGTPGDRLWVREAFRLLDSFDGDSPARVGDLCLLAGYPKPWAPVQYEADGARDNWMSVCTVPGSTIPGKLRPGIHMPRWASRITLEITGVRVERLQDISEADAIAEGCANSLHLRGGRFANENFAHLWWQINGDGSWEANPWVWVIEFRRIGDDR